MIVFNGKTYATVEEMPAEVREAYQKAMEMLSKEVEGNLLDKIERKVIDKSANRVEITTTEFFVNGKKYSSIEEMPADVRRQYEKALAAIETAMPGAAPEEITEANITRTRAEGLTASNDAQPSAMLIPPTPSVISEASINLKKILFVGGLILLIVLAATALFLLSAP